MSEPRPAATAELEALLGTLRGLRASVLGTLSGLGPDQARRSTVASGTNLAGLVQHLTFVEGKFFELIVTGHRPSRGSRSMTVGDTVSLSALRADYRAACDRSDEIARSVGDPAAVVGHGRSTHELRWVILAVIEETARHAGHADIIREQIDGRAGR